GRSRLRAIALRTTTARREQRAERAQTEVHDRREHAQAPRGEDRVRLQRPKVHGQLERHFPADPQVPAHHLAANRVAGHERECAFVQPRKRVLAELREDPPAARGGAGHHVAGHSRRHCSPADPVRVGNPCVVTEQLARFARLVLVGVRLAGGAVELPPIVLDRRRADAAVLREGGVEQLALLLQSDLRLELAELDAQPYRPPFRCSTGPVVWASSSLSRKVSMPPPPLAPVKRTGPPIARREGTWAAEPAALIRRRLDRCAAGGALGGACVATRSLRAGAIRTTAP